MRRMRPLLGTFVEIAVDGAPPPRLAAAVAAAFAAVERVQALMSFHDPGSDVARINAASADETVALDAQTCAVLQAARAIGDASEGAFDIAVAPVLVRDGLLPDHFREHRARPVCPGPTAEPTTLQAPTLETTYRDLELLPGARVRWRREGRIDLGGIAKGHAVDRAVDALRAHGIPSGVVNAGGDLRCFGEPQPLHVRSAHDAGLLVHAGMLRDEAAATSAGYFQSNRGAALVDPTTHERVAWNGSVTVIAGDCMTADALTKVIRLAPRLASRALRQFGARVVLVDEAERASRAQPRGEP